MVLEFWSIHMELMMEAGLIQPIKRGIANDFSHLLFADDLLVFCRANKKSLLAINELLMKLELNTGLSINKEKSRIYFSKGTKQRAELCLLTGFKVGSFPTRYLGIPLSVSYLKSGHYVGLIDKIRHKLEGWASQTLSIGGRVELIKSVIFGMINYWALSFKLPSKVINQINSLCLNFLWPQKFHPWSWVDICRPKSEGGLGIRRLQDVNAVTGIKLLWNCLTKSGLLGQWLNKKYLKQDDIWSIPHTYDASGTWKFVLESRIKAVSCLSHNSVTDTWSLLGNNSSHFSFKRVWEHIRLQDPPLPFYKTIWTNAAPKMSICLLRAFLGKLPTKAKLAQFGSVSDTSCVFCSNGIDTEEHLFFLCPYINRLWKLSCLKLKLHHQIQDLKHELTRVHMVFRGKFKSTAVAKCALAATVWHSWAERNRRIFKHEALAVHQLHQVIQRDCITLVEHCHWKHSPGPEATSILSRWGITSLC